ncbi:MAG: hypothetical protein VX938_08230, partial [Myxococcota bacterium]|nr:hypothetical protein [Myxococcota bacterium]
TFKMEADSCLGSCSGKTCGDDGCGGSCGACEGGICTANGVCQGSPSTRVHVGGHLTLEQGATLVSRGDIWAEGPITVGPGATLELDASRAEAPWDTVYRLALEGAGVLNGEGLEDNLCQVRSNGNGAPGRILASYEAYPQNGGDFGGRIEAERCVFSRLGATGYPAWRYQGGGEAGNEISIQDCRFQEMGLIQPNYLLQAPAQATFKGNLWTDSVPLGTYAMEGEQVTTPEYEGSDVIFGARSEANLTVEDNHFDGHVFLDKIGGATLRGNVFAGGVKQTPTIAQPAPWASFEKNLVVLGAGETLSLPWGNDLTDNLFVLNAPNEEIPEFIYVEHGEGQTHVQG